MFYIIILVVAVLLVMPLKENKESPIAKVLFIISFLISFLPAGLRYGIGTDYFYTYVPYFYWIGNGTKEFSEQGFNLLNKIIFNLTGDYKILFFVTAFIILGFIYKAIWDNSDNKMQSVLLIFIGQSYFYSMNLVRQAIAMAIILWSFKFLKNKKYFKALICILLASSFHVSALLMIPILLISTCDIKSTTKVVIIMLLIICKPIISNIIEYLMGFTKYNWYFQKGLFTENIAITLVIQNLIIFLLDIYYQKIYKDKVSKELKILSNINFIGICMMSLSTYVPLIYRIIRYCTIFQILYIPKLLNLSTNKENKMCFSSGLMLLMFICMYYQIIICGGEEVYPYVSIFNVR